MPTGSSPATPASLRWQYGRGSDPNRVPAVGAAPRAASAAWQACARPRPGPCTRWRMAAPASAAAARTGCCPKQPRCARRRALRRASPLRGASTLTPRRLATRALPPPTWTAGTAPRQPAKEGWREGTARVRGRQTPLPAAPWLPARRNRTVRGPQPPLTRIPSCPAPGPPAPLARHQQGPRAHAGCAARARPPLAA